MSPDRQTASLLMEGVAMALFFACMFVWVGVLSGGF